MPHRDTSIADAETSMQNTNPIPLVVAGVAIRQDVNGRYCLNDLHDAAIKEGANQRTKEPAKFLASPQIVDLVKEIETTQNLGSLPVVTIMGRNGGTYVCRELVYAYAMWISPALGFGFPTPWRKKSQALA